MRSPLYLSLYIHTIHLYNQTAIIYIRECGFPFKISSAFFTHQQSDPSRFCLPFLPRPVLFFFFFLSCYQQHYPKLSARKILMLGFCCCCIPGSFFLLPGLFLMQQPTSVFFRSFSQNFLYWLPFVFCLLYFIFKGKSSRKVEEKQKTKNIFC